MQRGVWARYYSVGVPVHDVLVQCRKLHDVEDELDTCQKKLSTSQALVKELNDARARMRKQKEELRMKVGTAGG